MKKILITGRGESGSWQIRAVQLGAAIGATVMPHASDAAIAAHDIVVMIKRPPHGLADRIHAAGKMLVHDIVDAWPQPDGNDWEKFECISWLYKYAQDIRPSAIVAATKAMAFDCESLGVPVLALPHHARPGLSINPIREQIKTIGYEGAEHYVGRWRAIVETECFGRGWQFVINPNALSDVDIVVALRDSVGYAPQNWKSNVKLANAQGSGTPFIGVTEAGYLETASGAEYFVNDRRTLAMAFDWLTDQTNRKSASAILRAKTPRLSDIANTYKTWLESL